MHPCQLLLFALHSDLTRKFSVLLGHELSALNDLLRGIAQVLLWVVSTPQQSNQLYSVVRRKAELEAVGIWGSVSSAIGQERPFGPSVGGGKHGLYALYSLQKSGPVVH